jgi:glycosyltransferase involved in cell wall biosynthesis
MTRSNSSDPNVIRIATLLSVPLTPGSGLGAFVLGLFERLRQRDDLAMVLIAPDRERGAAGRRGAQVLLALGQWLRLLRTRPHVIHVHDHPALLASAVLYQLMAHRNVHVIFSSHLDPAGPRSRWKRRLLGLLLARCTAVTVVSRSSVDKLGLFAEPVPPEERVRIVPGAASVRIREKRDPDVAAYAASVQYDGGPVVLQVTNFVYPAKVAGTLRLLEAFVAVRQHAPNAQLIVLGRGPLAPRAQVERDRLGLGGGAVHLPATFVEDLSLPVGLSDIHCHITGQDACPISILEAMHAGKPIVASRIGGIPEVIEHGVTGLLVDDDAGEIAASIVRLIDDPEYARQLGERARLVAQRRFTWDRVASDIEAIYREAVSGPERAYKEAVPVGQ